WRNSCPYFRASSKASTSLMDPITRSSQLSDSGAVESCRWMSATAFSTASSRRSNSFPSSTVMASALILRFSSMNFIGSNPPEQASVRSSEEGRADIRFASPGRPRRFPLGLPDLGLPGRGGLLTEGIDHRVPAGSLVVGQERFRLQDDLL